MNRARNIYAYVRWDMTRRVIFSNIDWFLIQGEELWALNIGKTYDDDRILLVLDYIESAGFVHMMTSNAKMSSLSFQTENMNLCSCVTSNIMVHTKLQNNYNSVYICVYNVDFVLLFLLSIESTAYVLYWPYFYHHIMCKG